VNINITKTINNCQIVIFALLLLLLLQSCKSNKSETVKSIVTFKDKALIISYDHKNNNYAKIKLIDSNLLKPVTVDNQKTMEETFTIVDVFDDNGSLTLLANQGQGGFYNPYKKVIFFNLNSGNTLKISRSLPRYYNFVGCDESYYYFYTPENISGLHNLTTTKLDTRMNQFRSFHFKEDRRIVVIKIINHDESWWYLCMRNPFLENRSYAGQLILAQKNMKNSRLYFYKNLISKPVYPMGLIACNESILLFVSLHLNSDHYLLKFNKENKRVETYSINGGFNPINHSCHFHNQAPNHCRWLVDCEQKNVYRMNIEDLTMQQVQFPNKFSYDTAFYDTKYVWIGGKLEDQSMVIRFPNNNSNCKEAAIIPLTKGSSLKTKKSIQITLTEPTSFINRDHIR